ncbi:MAG: lactate racemase domain-containing protein [Bacteroidota bacterium]
MGGAPAVIDSQAYSPDGLLEPEAVAAALSRGLGGKFANAKVLALIPDSTRSLPLPMLFRMIMEILGDACRLDFMIALGTHPPMSDEQINRLVGISAEERLGRFKHIRLLNHAWDDPAMLASLGVMGRDEIRQIAGASWHSSLPDQVDIRLNKLALEYDHILIIGPTFPHEVAGFSGGAKYLFPGISGPDVINATHWLGALTGVVGTIGIKDTPVRAMIHAAARRLRTPVTLAALLVEGRELAGVVVGDMFTAWEAAADLSARRHIRWCEKPFQRVLSCAPPMYDELWTAGKAMYKIEPAVAVGGEVILYAPHLDVVSRVHGRYIYEIGYHILPYFLRDWERFKHVPLGVLAHSTHVRGSGVMEGGAERPNVRLSLASRIPPEDCARLNLGYVNPAEIDADAWKDREAEGILYVPRAGEILFRRVPPA